MLWTRPGIPVRPRAFEAVLFDLDGTLIDSSPDLTVSINVALAAHGLPGRSEEEVRRFVGDGARRLVARSLPPGREELVAPVLERFRRHYGEHLLVHTRVYDGIGDLIERLQRLPLAVVSNKPEGFVRAIIEQLGWGSRFRALLGGDSLPTRKPDPRVLVEACHSVAVAPAAALMVGDGVQDVEAARRAGLSSCGAAWGFRGAEVLRAAQAEYVAEAPTELLQVVAL